MGKYLVAACMLSLFALNADATCTGCHTSHEETIARSPHDVLAPSGDPSESCVSCHGDGAGHPGDSSGLLAFGNETRARQDEACGTCHTRQHPGSSAHARAGVSCVDCHSVHEEPAQLPTQAGFENLDAGSASCAGCHDDVLAEFAFNRRHRLQENSVTCTSCHNPHDKALALRLGSASKSLCEGCHADKEGPFVFEHEAARVDGCLACHTPHGSSNRHLLTHQQTGELCYGCHAEVPQFHLGFAPAGSPRFGADSVCTNCHVTIHGSNLDRAFLK